jgi:hypothetical protein
MTPTTSAAHRMSAKEPALYRYGKREYAQEFLERGRLRVGTLHDFRRSEHKRGIADPQEGKKRVSHIINTSVGYDRDDASPDRRALEVFGVLAPGSRLQAMFVDCTVSRNIDAPDCFLLCMSETLSNETMAEFDGAESCYQIVNRERFAQILTEEINRHVPVDFRGVHRVKYQERAERWNGLDWGKHPALIKELAFRGQSEIRMMWVPKRPGPIEFFYVEAPELAKCCVEVALPERQTLPAARPATTSAPGSGVASPDIPFWRWIIANRETEYLMTEETARELFGRAAVKVAGSLKVYRSPNG